jgi:hypothetical protein
MIPAQEMLDSKIQYLDLDLPAGQSLQEEEQAEAARYLFFCIFGGLLYTVVGVHYLLSCRTRVEKPKLYCLPETKLQLRYLPSGQIGSA